VGLALFGLAAGLVEKLRPQGPDHVTVAPASATQKAAVDAFIKFRDLNNKISSKMIRDHTIKLKDIAKKQVLDWTYLQNIQKLESGLKTIKLTDAAIKAQLTNRIVGHGSVISGIKIVPAHTQTQAVADDLLTVPGVLHVGAYNDDAGPYIKIENLTSSQLQLVAESDTGISQPLDPAGQSGAQSKTIKFKLGEYNLFTVQLLGDQQPPVTLTVSSLPVAGTSDNEFVAQALASSK
jgi:hypothetical protein